VRPAAASSSWPGCATNRASRCHGTTWTRASAWTFEPLDDAAFPAVALAKRVGREGGTYPAVFNAANEQAVEAFHAGALSFLGIVETVERVVEAHRPPSELSRESLAEAESWARNAADRAIGATR